MAPARGLTSAPSRSGLLLQKMLAILFFAIWVASAIVLTFDAPFTSTSNGFFGACALPLSLSYAASQTCFTFVAVIIVDLIGTWFATFFATMYLYQLFDGGDMNLARGLRQSLSFHHMEDLKTENSSAGLAEPIPPSSSNIA